VLIIALALALLGLLLGSFAGVIAFRVPRGESPLGGRSMCDECGAAIAARDNVPVVSWLALRGRCRSCDAPIPLRYPLVELGLAAGFAATYLVLESEGTAEVVLGCTFLFVLAIITLTDLERRIIPNAVLAPAAVAAVAITLIGDPDLIGQRLLAAAIAGGALLLVAMLYPRGMGMGDVKLAAVMGLYLGRAVGPALLFGFLVGALYGVALIAGKGAEARKTAVPFGPFLALGGVVGLLLGDEIVDWYVDAFFSG
jgi:leader peptidase (prepilin peptidase) / N-methyltransferase